MNTGDYLILCKTLEVWFQVLNIDVIRFKNINLIESQLLNDPVYEIFEKIIERIRHECDIEVESGTRVVSYKCGAEILIESVLSIENV